MHADKSRAGASGPGGARGRGVKPAGSPGPRPGVSSHRAAAGSRTTAPAKVDSQKAASQRGREVKKRPTSPDKRPEWNSSPPEMPRRASSGNPNKPANADKSPTRRNSPAKQPASAKPAPPGKSGIPKRTLEGSSVPESKPNKAKNSAVVRNTSTNNRPGRVRPTSSNKPAGRVAENGAKDQKDRLTVPTDRPRAGSITGAGKSELGKFLEKLHLEEMYGSSDDEPDHARRRDSLESINTWRTGDGDDDEMNTLRTKPRTKEPSISPSWKFADVVIPKKSDDEKATKPKLKNRFSFLVDSTDEDEPNVKPTNGNGMDNDFSRFDSFVRESLSPERNKTDTTVSRKKPEPVSERIVRPSTAAQSGSARRGAARSRSRSKDRDRHRGTVRGDGSRRDSFLDEIIQPSAPKMTGSPTSQGGERRSTAPRLDRSAQSRATKPSVTSKPNGRAAEDRRQSSVNSHRSNSRTPSPEKIFDSRKKSSTGGQEVPVRHAPTNSRRNSSRNQQDVKKAHQRRSRTPSPDTADILERYHDVYPDDAAKITSPFAEDWPNRRSSRYSREKNSPSSRDQPSAKVSRQNGNSVSLSEAPKGDYYSPATAVQLRERRADEHPDDKKVKRKSLSLAGMSNPERGSTGDEGDRLR